MYLSGIAFTNIDDASETAKVYQFGGTGEYYLETTVGTESVFPILPLWDCFELTVENGDYETKRFVNDKYRDTTKLASDTTIPASKYFRETVSSNARYWLVASGGKIAWAHTDVNGSAYAGISSFSEYIPVVANFVQ